MLISLCVIEVRLPPALMGRDCFLHKAYSNTLKWTTVNVLYVTTWCRLILELFSLLPIVAGLVFLVGGGGILAACLPYGAAPSASMINAAAYLPSLGSGVPFRLLYTGAPTVGTERTRRGLFLLHITPPVPWTHHRPGINPSKKKKKINQPEKENYQGHNKFTPLAAYSNQFWKILGENYTS